MSEETKSLNAKFAFCRDFYLSFSKLSSLKRVNRVVEAFREMPDQKLLVIYGENDPQKDEIMSMAS